MSSSSAGDSFSLWPSSLPKRVGIPITCRCFFHRQLRAQDVPVPSFYCHPLSSRRVGNNTSAVCSQLYRRFCPPADRYTFFGYSTTALSSEVSSRRAGALILLWYQLSTRWVAIITLADFAAFAVLQFYRRWCPQGVPVFPSPFMVKSVVQSGRYHFFGCLITVISSRTS